MEPISPSEIIPDDHSFSVSELVDIIQSNDVSSHAVFRFASGRESPLSYSGTVRGDDYNLTDDVDEVLRTDNGTSVSDGILSLEDNPDLEAFKENVKNRKRKLKADPASWSRQVNRMKRMRGESYHGFDVTKSPNSAKKKYTFGRKRSEKRMGTRCRSKYCIKRTAICCEEFTEENRKEIFDYFWKNLDWGQKKSYVASLVDSVPVKRRKKDSTSKRTDTFIYCLKSHERRVQVCRKTFLSTLGLGLQQVLGWIKASNSGIPKSAPKRTRQAVTSEATKNAELFLNELPKLPSHYCRRSSSKMYLETHITTKSKVLHLYQDHCKRNKWATCSRTQFNKILARENIGIFSPRKDRCDTCVGYENGQVLENEYNSHIYKKNLARDQKVADKADALQEKCHVLTIDLQAVKLSPVLNASSLYYKTKLMSHNFTVYNLKTKDAVCYWWDETEGDLSASSFASCLIDFIKSYLKDTSPIIIYSDGCVSQNRNKDMGNALLELSISQNRIITQKYLEKGHTQMECDSVHSVIEGKLKNQRIYTPDDYLDISRKARSSQPYIVRKLDHTFFKNFSLKTSHRYTSIRPGSMKGDACVTHLKNIKYLPQGKIQYKLSYEQLEWNDLPEKPKKILSIKYPPLFTSRRNINARKFKDLQDLKAVIPAKYHSFYDNIPHDEK